jgi:hypothetical protein
VAVAVAAIQQAVLAVLEVVVLVVEGTATVRLLQPTQAVVVEVLEILVLAAAMVQLVVLA